MPLIFPLYIYTYHSVAKSEFVKAIEYVCLTDCPLRTQHPFIFAPPEASSLRGFSCQTIDRTPDSDIPFSFSYEEQP